MTRAPIRTDCTKSTARSQARHIRYCPLVPAYRNKTSTLSWFAVFAVFAAAAFGHATSRSIEKPPAASRGCPALVGLWPKAASYLCPATFLLRSRHSCSRTPLCCPLRRCPRSLRLCSTPRRLLSRGLDATRGRLQLKYCVPALYSS